MVCFVLTAGSLSLAMGSFAFTRSIISDPRIVPTLAIRIRSDGLESGTIATAKRIGEVVVDHGQTSCQTPDAVPYIQKAAARRRKKARK